MIARATMVAAVLLALGAGLALAQGEEQDEAAEYEMTKFQLVFLSEEWVETPTPEHQMKRVPLAQEHFRSTMANSGAILITGPVADAEELREVAVARLESPEKAVEVFSRSPAVHVGQQKVRAYTLWAADGILQKAPDHTDRVDCYLGLLKRRYPIKHFPDEELEEIQAGHMANIKKMADSGDLVIAGPVEDEEEELRGILIFRTRDPEKIKRLVAEDPAIQKGRLVLELYRWNVANGIFPKPESGS